MGLKDLIQEFRNKRILIVGDVMIDAYIWGEHTRESPEAPVPVVDVLKREARLGGAANVALNVKALGAEAMILSVVGDSQRATEYMDLMQQAGLGSQGIILSPERRCTVKTRVISNDKHMMRVDEEDTHDLSEQEAKGLVERYRELIEQGYSDAVILQDYNKGVLSASVITELITIAQAHQVPTMVDPKFKNFLAYEQATFFKPNLKELRDGLHTDIASVSVDELDAITDTLRAQMPHQLTMVTLSEHGVYWRDDDGSGIIPVFPRDIIDVSGAGDTVIATATLALVSGAHIAQSALISNLAGGLVCEQVGVQPIDREALQNEILSLNL